MKKEILNQISITNYIEDQGLKYGYFLSIFRFVLQSAAYSAYEAAADLTDHTDRLKDQSRRLLQPSDGDFVETLDICIPALRDVWPSLAQGWFDHRGTDYANSGFGICQSIIQTRNDRIGHGVFDKKTLDSALEVISTQISTLIEILSDLLPSSPSDHQNSSILKTPQKSIPIQLIRRHSGGVPILIRKIEKRGSVWRIQGQLLDHINSQQIIVEISDECQLIQLQSSKSSTELDSRQIHVGNNVWRCSTLLPLRQTQTFEGRSQEKELLLEWWGDMDSRACYELVANSAFDHPR